MSITKRGKFPFLKKADLGTKFSFAVIDWQERDTQFGRSVFLYGQKIMEHPKDKALKGLLGISATTIGSFAPWAQHLDDLVGYTVAFEWDDGLRTILCTGVTEWTGEDIIAKGKNTTNNNRSS